MPISRRIMQRAHFLIIILAFDLALTGCAIIRMQPLSSAALVKTWTKEAFIDEMRENESKRNQDLFGSKNNQFNPSYFLPTEDGKITDLIGRLKSGDQVLWYSDTSIGCRVDYICIRRSGRIIHIYKIVEPKHETLATWVPADRDMLNCGSKRDLLRANLAELGGSGNARACHPSC